MSTMSYWKMLRPRGPTSRAVFVPRGAFTQLEYPVDAIAVVPGGR